MYSPRVKEEYIGRLYLLCKELGVPMTAFVNGVVGQALVQAETHVGKGEKAEALRLLGASVATETATGK